LTPVFRRCGIEFSCEPQDFPLEKFTPGQLKKLREDKLLVCQTIDTDVDKEIASPLITKLEKQIAELEQELSTLRSDYAHLQNDYDEISRQHDSAEKLVERVKSSAISRKSKHV